MVRLYPVYDKNSADRESPTTNVYIPTVLNRATCEKHNALLGDPCFYVPRKDENGYLHGICNTRAKSAGFTNPIRPQSLDRSLNRPATRN